MTDESAAKKLSSSGAGLPGDEGDPAPTYRDPIWTRFVALAQLEVKYSWNSVGVRGDVREMSPADRAKLGSSWVGARGVARAAESRAAMITAEWKIGGLLG